MFVPPYLYQCLEPGEPQPICEQMKREGQVINEVAHDSKVTLITVSLANNKLQSYIFSEEKETKKGGYEGHDE